MIRTCLGLALLGGLLACGHSPTEGSTSGGGTSGSSSGGSSSGGGGSSGWTGSISVDGGELSTLFFAAVGDTRPANEGATASYPTMIISQIFTDLTMQAPQFVVATGDYQYAKPSTSAGAAQLTLYAQARAMYPGLVFPVMGNHECDGYTADNCDTNGNIVMGGSGMSANYAAFKSTLLDPINQPLPYYSFNINDTAGKWTAKFVFIAANAWDSTQSAWLTATLAVSTTYTFIMRHEEASASTAPGVNPSEAIINNYPYTLKIVGHAHSFYQSESKEIVVGNGGAPLDESSDQYGYALFTMLSNGQIQVQEMAYNSNMPLQTLPPFSP